MSLDFLSNIFGVQSDCPHRERFGYGGDLVTTCDTFMLNFDMARFYTKAIRDWHDSALADGMLTDTAPFVGIQYCGVAWAMAHPLLQAQLYRYYGDRRLIEEQYATAKRWFDCAAEKYPERIIKEGLSDHEGLAPAPAPEMVTPLYCESARLLAQLARICSGKDQDAHDLRSSKRPKRSSRRIRRNSSQRDFSGRCTAGHAGQPVIRRCSSDMLDEEGPRRGPAIPARRHSSRATRAA